MPQLSMETVLRAIGLILQCWWSKILKIKVFPNTEYANRRYSDSIFMLLQFSKAKCSHTSVIFVRTQENARHDQIAETVGGFPFAQQQNLQRT